MWHVPAHQPAPALAAPPSLRLWQLGAAAARDDSVLVPLALAAEGATAPPAQCLLQIKEA